MDMLKEIWKERQQLVEKQLVKELEKEIKKGLAELEEMV